MQHHVPVRNGWVTGTALVGAVPTQLSGGVPFISDSDLRAQLEAANVPAEQAAAVEKANSDARFTALRTSLLVVALVAIAALFCTGMIPVKPVGQPAGSVPADSAADGSPDDGRMDSRAEILGSSTAAESAGP